MRLVQVAERHSAIIDSGLRKAVDEELLVPVHFGDIGVPTAVRAEVWLRGSVAWSDFDQRTYGQPMIGSGPTLSGRGASLVLRGGEANATYMVRFLAEIGGVEYIRDVHVRVTQ